MTSSLTPSLSFDLLTHVRRREWSLWLHGIGCETSFCLEQTQPAQTRHSCSPTHCAVRSNASASFTSRKGTPVPSNRNHSHLGGYARITPGGRMDTISTLGGHNARALLFDHLSQPIEPASDCDLVFWSNPSRDGGFNPAATALTSYYSPHSPALLFGDVVVSRMNSAGQSAPLGAAEIGEICRVHSAITKQNSSTSY